MSQIHFKIFTIFPQLFPGALDISITKAALEKKIWSFEAIDIRKYATDNRGTVDDTPYGGGAGMVLKPDVIAAAFEQNKLFPPQKLTENLLSENNNFYSEAATGSISQQIFQNFSPKQSPRIFYLSPRGKPFKQKLARELAQESEIAILCGRYEGVDQRVIDEFAVEEISIGDYVLSGGEIACFVFIDAILRNLSGVLGAEESLSEESFGSKDECEYKNLLEYPHFTRPASWRGHEVPEILLSGHHKKIQTWRKEQALALTKKIRPDLL